MSLHPQSRDVPPQTLTAVVARPWNGPADGPTGHTVGLTTLPGDVPLPPVAEAADRRRLEPCARQARTPPGRRGVHRHDRPPGLGPSQHLQATDGRTDQR